MLRHDSDFFSHLEELRQRLIISLVVFIAATVVSYFFSHALLGFLTIPLHRIQGAELFFQKPYEAFLTHLQVATLTGVVVSSPVFLTQLWFFVAPGLYEKEKKILLPLIFVSVLLFLAGTLFAYFLVIPWGLQILLSFQTESLKPLLGIGPYFSFLSGMVIAFGLLFDFPVFLIGLVRLGVLHTKTLARTRKIIIALIFIAAAVLTPSPDPFSQILLAIPLILLFEISLAVGRLIEGRKIDTLSI